MQINGVFRRSGGKQDADRGLSAYRQAANRARETIQDIRSAILGRMTPAQTEEPPN